MRIVTSGIFEAFGKCPTKCYRLSKGESGFGNGFADWLKEQQRSYRDEGFKRLTTIISKTKQFDAGRLDSTDLKNGQWQFALNCVVSAYSWESYLDAIERNAQSKQNKSFLLIPVRFVRTNKVTIEDKLLVAYDAHILSGMTGCKILFGKLIYGPGYRNLKVKTSNLANKVRRQIEQIIHCVSESKAPGLILSRRCTECEFQVSCRREGIEKDDLSLLAGMTEKERKKLNGKGIFTVTQLSYTFRPRRRPKRFVLKNEKYHQALKALAIREQKVHVVGKPELNIGGTPVYLDVEGLPDQEIYFLIGIRIPAPDGFIQRSFWADNYEDEKQIWESFLGLLASVDNPTLIHYGSFETTFLKRMVARYGCPINADLDKAIESPVNLLSLIYARIYFPTYSNGLKDLAKFLGFKWSEPNVSGAQAIVWRQEWEKSGNPIVKQKLIEYNAEDCEGLQRVENFVNHLFAPHGASPDHKEVDVVNTESLTRETLFKFRRVQFRLPEFDEINRAAYWDYQRDKILVKSSKRIKNIKKVQKRRLAKPRPNKTIDWPAPTECPKCGVPKIWKHIAMSKTVLDVKFGSFGIKRWVTNYLFHRYQCQQCGATFLNTDRAWSRKNYGPNIRALSVYGNIELGLPLMKVGSFLKQMFGLDISSTLTNDFKTSAATFYKETYEGLYKSIISGHLVHVDETKVSLKQGIGYVWVITNLEEAVYFYSPTREGDFIHLLLKDFKGVLVSDFYTAYDSVDCPQQKCLIHLIRDLNDDLLKEPFNEEVKEIASEFGRLLRPMIETVERFGLKIRFLKKHKIFVDRFFKSVEQRDYQTETAVKCKKRILKNRRTLFAFLDYDNIPWNNNNAEHAIKAFAVLRRNFSGVTTEKGIREYLILVSICETCRFKGINFLDFLRSGEKDIDLFESSRKKKPITSQTEYWINQLLLLKDLIQLYHR